MADTMNEFKRQAAIKALEYIEDDCIIGIGSGTTVNYLIEQLVPLRGRIDSAIAASRESEKRLKQIGIPVIDLNVASKVSIYFDGADEINHHKEMIKGGGGALTREKIIANCADEFICLVDESKQVTRLGRFPVAVEVIPMARSYVAREIVKLSGDPEYREGYTTDNGNIIIDIHNMEILEPLKLERALNNIAGVVCNGVFAQRCADKVIIGTAQGVQVQ